jgi:hypothetical protein
MIPSSLKIINLTDLFPKNKGLEGKISLAAFLTAAFLALLLFFALPAGAAAKELTPQEEAALFSLSDLGKVDLSTKTVTVEIFIAPDPEMAPCRRMMALVWAKVQEFYAPLGVNLVPTEGRAEPGPLAPAQRLRVEMLTHKEWLARSFKAFDVAPPFRLRFLQVCRDKCAFAHLPLSVVHVSFKRFQDAEGSAGSKDAEQNRHWLANLLIHELGHLLGLYHAHEFVNDPIPEILADGKTPNFMSHEIAFRSKLGAVDFQKRLIHSFLGKGKVYQQYAQVDFDPLRYLELIKKHNGYQEPKDGKKDGMQKKSGKLGNPKTFDDYDEEDDEDLSKGSIRMKNSQ